MAAQSGIKIVMASHDLGQVRRLAGDVIFLVRGALCEQGPAADFLDTRRRERPAHSCAAISDLILPQQEHPMTFRFSSFAVALLLGASAAFTPAVAQDRSIVWPRPPRPRFRAVRLPAAAVQAKPVSSEGDRAGHWQALDTARRAMPTWCSSTQVAEKNSSPKALA